MKTADEQRIENIVGTIMASIFALIFLALAVILLATAYDMGQLNGYCKAEGGKVEDSICVKDDTVIKRGKDI